MHITQVRDYNKQG